MPTKLDFTAEAEPDKPFTGIKVGLRLQLLQQEDGSWSCNRAEEDGGDVLCAVPAAAAASLAAAQRQQQHGGPAPTAAVRSVKRCQDNPDAAASIRVRVSFPAAHQQGGAPSLQQDPAPADDPTGFSLTTTELEHLAFNEEVRHTLRDKRLQEALLKIDGAPNREQALQQAMANPDFQEFADKMLHVMKPAQYPPA